MNDEREDESNWAELGMEELQMSENPYVKLASIDVGAHVDKKNGLSYLPWAWAVDQLLRADPSATWEYDEPKMYGETMMVFCTVTAFGRSRKMQLPVMDHRNRAIPNPDAFAVNTAMQRCLVKAIGAHGLGLYIYAGEDLPFDPNEPDHPKDARPEPPKEPPKAPSGKGLTATDEMIANSLTILRDASLNGNDALDKAVLALAPAIKARLLAERRDELTAIREAAIKVDFDAGAAAAEAKARKAA